MHLKVLFILLQVLALDTYTPRKKLKSIYADVNETWTGKWFPSKPDFLNAQSRAPQKVEISVEHEHDETKIMNMSFCDDGQTNLTVDWNGDPADFICTQIKPYIPNFEKSPVLELYTIPKAYKPYPECMNVSIEYDFDIPTFGNHRRIWPKYGEYEYIPRQRWLHTVEHGGVVMLYHPCAHAHQVNILRRLVRKCLYRHIISPSRFLSPDMPLALVSWGKRLTMSFVQKETIIDFIKSSALNGVEHPTKIGDYSFGLQEEAGIVTDENDITLCPGL